MKLSPNALKKRGILWWPKSFKKRIAKVTSLPLLLESQEEFINILRVSRGKPELFLTHIKTTGFPANLFLKHLCVISDFGGEPIQRISREFKNLFEKRNGTFFMRYYFANKRFVYHFKVLPSKLNNKVLHIDGESLTEEFPLNDLLYDTCMLLMHGGSSTGLRSGNLDRCVLGSMLGNNSDLQKYIKTRYLHVSRISGGQKANAQGQLLQKDVFKRLKASLPAGSSVFMNKKAFFTLSKSKGSVFDIFCVKGKKKVGIEISFQETTNSTIEQKANKAADLYTDARKAGIKVVYLIDGAGNFQRSSAIKKLIQNSDNAFTFKDRDLNRLCNYAKRSIC